MKPFSFSRLLKVSGLVALALVLGAGVSLAQSAPQSVGTTGQSAQAAGDQYRVAFHSSASTTATSTDIATYNA